MKVSAKIAIVGSILLVGGTALAVIGGLVAKINNEASTKPIIRDLEMKQIASTSVTALNLASVTDDIEISFSDTATELEIDYFDATEEDKRIYTVKETSSTFELAIRQDFWRDIFGFMSSWSNEEEAKHPVKVIAPTSMENLVVVASTVSGNINVNYSETSTPVSLGALVINNVSGSIKAKDVTTKKGVTVNTTSGETRFESCNSLDGSMELNSVSGATTLKNCTIKNEVEINNPSGKITLDQFACRSLNISAVSGAVTGKGLNIEKKVTVSNVSGAVSLGFVDSKDNYAISLTSVSGSKNVENVTDATKEKEIEVTTTSGAINLSFAE